MKTTKALLVIATLLLATTAQASYVYTGAWSQHIPAGDYNQDHRTLGYEHNQWLAAYFVNSHDTHGAFAGYHWGRQHGHVRYGAIMGAVYGYSDCYGGGGKRKIVCPLLAPTITYTRHRAQPYVGIWGNAAVVGLRWRVLP